MNTSLLALGGILLGGMLMRLPIGFSMIGAGIAYLTVKSILLAVPAPS